MVVKLDPKNAEAWYDLGDTLRESGNLQDGLKAINESILLLPSFGPSHYCRGRILLKLGDSSGAKDAFEAAFQFDPELKKDFDRDYPNAGALRFISRLFRG